MRAKVSKQILNEARKLTEGRSIFATKKVNRALKKNYKRIKRGY